MGGCEYVQLVEIIRLSTNESFRCLCWVCFRKALVRPARRLVPAFSWIVLVPTASGTPLYPNLIA